MGGYAWVTLATNDAYSLGALVLAHSLRRVGTKYELACLVTPGVTETMREKLAAVFSLVQEVNVLDSKDEANLALLARPELGITFTKLHCWRLTQYEKCVFVDADALVVQNCDELFEREELSAAPDVGWPDCFNSGVFVFRPSQQTFASITAFAAAKGSFDGGDQGLLNMYFSDWATKDISKHLPFIYNMCSTATYSYLPAFKQFGEDVRIIHFIGITKPWLQYFDSLTSTVQPPSGSTHLQPLLQLWWNIFCERVHPQLSPSMATSTLAPIWHAFTPPSYVLPFPKISDYSDGIQHNVHDSRVPDFSEFKDPWEECELFSNDDNSVNDNSKFIHYYEIKNEKEVAHQSDHSAIQVAQIQQFFHEQQHSSHTLTQTHDQHREHVPSYNEKSCDEEPFVQHIEHHHWQPHNEQRHNIEQHQRNEQWIEQKHDVQHQHHEQRHHNEQQQHNGHHQQFHQHDHHNNKADDHRQHRQEFQSAEVRHEDHAQYHTNSSNQASHKNADYLSHISPHNEYHAEHTGNHEALEAANNKRDARRIDFLPPSPAPCTDLHNVAMRSDPNVTEHLDNANAGIAGALAQITLGEARSAEQIALEEHMRKQSWEQGQIDYMGRDSFDNIWKKICETLSSASQSQTTSPKEDTATPETAKETAIKEITDALADVKMDKPAVEADKDPTQSLICEISKEEKLSATQIEQSASSEKDNVAKAASMKVLSELSEDVCAKPVTELKDIKSQEIDADAPSPQPLIESLSVEQREPASQTQEAVSQDENLKTKELQQADSQAPPLDCKLPSQETIADLQIDSTKSASTEAKMEAPTSVSQDVTQPAAPISLGSPQDANIASPAASETTAKETTKHVTEFTLDLSQPLTIDPGEQHADVLSAASEISTVSPVPIQVAESVLQAEPKESILGAASTMSDQAIATTVTAVHESTEVTSAPVPMEPVQMNGSACEVERCSGVKDAALVSGLPEKTNAPPEAIKESASDLVISKDAPSEVPPVIEETILTSSSTIALKTSAKESVEASKPAEEIIKAETVEEKSVEQEVTASTTEAEAAKLPSEVPESPIAEQSAPKEPIEAKPSNIPSTPTVIEATPPISPCVESTKEELETEEKKGLKKSDSTEADGESADKKGAKKAVKKVTKKPKKPEEAASSIAAEGATADSSQNKAKKAVKTAKKTSTKTLETDTSAPETPPPPTSASAVGVDAPVPPKRKTKSTNSKGSGKKSEAEE